MSECIFCEIIEGRAEATFLWRDETVSAFLDTQPINAGHALVVPNAHATHLADLPEATGAHMFRVAQRLARALRAADVPCAGVNLFLADGAAAGQDVFHSHLHVVPRNPGDGFGFTFGPAYRTPPGRSELDGVGLRLAAALQAAEEDTDGPGPAPRGARA